MRVLANNFFIDKILLEFLYLEVQVLLVLTIMSIFSLVRSLFIYKSKNNDTQTPSENLADTRKPAISGSSDDSGDDKNKKKDQESQESWLSRNKIYLKWLAGVLAVTLVVAGIWYCCASGESSGTLRGFDDAFYYTSEGFNHYAKMVEFQRHYVVKAEAVISLLEKGTLDMSGDKSQFIRIVAYYLGWYKRFAALGFLDFNFENIASPERRMFVAIALRNMELLTPPFSRSVSSDQTMNFLKQLDELYAKVPE